MRSPRGVAAAIIAAAAAAAAIATCQPAAARSIAPAPVRLGAHHFGQLRPADAIVARAGRNEVGFVPGHEGASIGPWSFDLAPDGSVWVLDEVNDRLLVWRAGRPDRPVRTVPLPFKAAVDLVVGPDGTVYVTSGGEGPDHLYALWPDGRVRWRSVLPTDQVIGTLHATPDGTVNYHYHDSAEAWAPLTDTRGRPLPAAERRRRTGPHAPLPGGYRLAVAAPSGAVRRLTLLDTTGAAVRGWHVTSDTALGALIGAPTLVGDDLVVTFEVSVRRSEFLYEYLVLRLGPAGQIRQRFALDARAVWGEHQTDLRVGPDSRLYQLRTSPTTGVRVARYSLDPDPPAPPTTTTVTTSGPTRPHGPNPPTTDEAGTGQSAADPPTTDPPTTLPDLLTAVDAAPAAQAAPRPAGPMLILWLSAVISTALAAIGAWLLHRHRRVGRGPAR
jgi:hypothetical protein